MPSTELWELPRPKVCHELLRDWALMSFHRESVKRHKSPASAQPLSRLVRHALQHRLGWRGIVDQPHRFTHGGVRR